MISTLSLVVEIAMETFDRVRIVQMMMQGLPEKLTGIM
jgi:hypothetical protein